MDYDDLLSVPEPTEVEAKFIAAFKRPDTKDNIARSLGVSVSTLDRIIRRIRSKGIDVDRPVLPSPPEDAIRAREAEILRRLKDMQSLRKIAKDLDLPEGTIGTTLFRFRKRTNQQACKKPATEILSKQQRRALRAAIKAKAAGVNGQRPRLPQKSMGNEALTHICALDPGPAPGKPLQLNDLEPHHCRWPYGQDRVTHYCGRPRDHRERQMYCTQHHVINSAVKVRGDVAKRLGVQLPGAEAEGHEHTS
jgi:transposase